MPLVVIQTIVPGKDGHPFRIAEVLERTATSRDEALEAALVHIGGDREATGDCLAARWHDTGRYWLVVYEPVPADQRMPSLMLM